MEFWGVEVKSGQPLKVKPEFGKLVHISHAAAGEVKDAKGAKNVPLKVKFDGNEFVMGLLSADRPQVMFDLVFEREFELSHDWKQGSVYFIGYLADDPDSASDEEDFSSEFEDDLVGAVEKGSIKHISENVKPAAAKGEDSDSSDKDSDGNESSSDDGMPVIGEEGYGDLSSDDDSDELSESSDEEELPKTQQSMKRPAETAQKTPVSKKTKQATPDKSGNKKGHNATPLPSKTAAGKKSNEQPPKSAANNKKGQFQNKAKRGGK